MRPSEQERQRPPISSDGIEQLRSALPPFLHPSALATLLHVHPRTVDRWSRTGVLPPPLVLNGSRLKRYHRDAVLELVARAAGLLLLALVVVAFSLLDLAFEIDIDLASAIDEFPYPIRRVPGHGGTLISLSAWS